MRSITMGDSIIFDIVIRDSNGDLYDPPDVTLSVIRGGSTIIYGPYTYSAEEILKVSNGAYRYTVTIEDVLTPGLFTAKWTYVLDGDTQVVLEDFTALDSDPTPSTLQDAPRRYGIIKETNLYQTMGIGLTDRVFLIGHADGIGINSPYEVRDMKETINSLGGDGNSPLVRGLLECYNGGCRDLWVMAAAPMDEYVEYDPRYASDNRFLPNDEWGGLNFLERYNERLTTTYSVLLDYDLPEIIVPIEAPYYDSGGVDFLTPLVNHCNSQFTLTGSPAIGIMGTRIGIHYTESEIEEMASDSRLLDIGSEGKFTMVVIGEGIFRHSQMTASYVGSMECAAAAALATSSLDRGITYRKMRNVVTRVGRDLMDEEVSLLTNAALNPIIKTQRGKRGEPYQVVLATDNVLGYGGNIGQTDFYSVAQVRLVSKVIGTIRTISQRRIGSIGFAMLKGEIDEYLSTISLNGMIRGYTFNMVRDPLDKNRALVDVSLKPHFGLREISFTVEVGPGA